MLYKGNYRTVSNLVTKDVVANSIGLQRSWGFLRDSVINAFGIACGQLILIATTPLLARMYSPQQFGVYASLVAVTGVLATGAALRFDVALPAVQQDKVAPLFKLGLLTCLTTAILLIVVTFFGLHLLIPWPHVLASQPMATICVLAAAIQGVLYLAVAHAVRSGSFRQTAILRILQPSMFALAALLAIPGGLTLAFVSGLAIACIAGLVFCASELRQPVSLIALKQTAQKYWEYPAISLPMAMLDGLTLAMPLLFIVGNYGEAAAGNYSQVQRLVAAPLLLAGAAISQVFFKHVGDAYRSGASIRPFLWKTVRWLATIGVVLLVAAALLGEPVLSLFLGQGWRTDTRFLMLLLIPVLSRACVSPISTVFLICNQVRLGALWQLIYFTGTWLVLTSASSRLDLDGFLLILIVSEFFMYSLYLWMADIAVRQVAQRS